MNVQAKDDFLKNCIALAGHLRTLNTILLLREAQKNAQKGEATQEQGENGDSETSAIS